MSLVLDCSIAISWLFEDEASKATDDILDLVKQNGAFVPNLWHLEVLNVLNQAAKRNRLKPEEIQTRLRLLNILPIQTDMETHKQAFTQTSDLILRTGLTSYDASYLELSIRKKLPLATKDKTLKNSAFKLNISTL